MTGWQIAAITTAALTLLLDVLTHRFQRTTLAIANLKTEGKGTRTEIARLQLAMTPDWIGTLGLLEYIFATIAAVLLFVSFPWWAVLGFGVLYLLGVFAGFGGLVIPLMSYPWNLQAVEKHLGRARLSHMMGSELPVGATTDIAESLDLSDLATGLLQGCAEGSISIEKCATGFIDEARSTMQLHGR